MYIEDVRYGDHGDIDRGLVALLDGWSIEG